MPSVQSPVAESMRPNIWGAVMACREGRGVITMLCMAVGTVNVQVGQSGTVRSHPYC
jgi:hypothetical protein